MIARKLHRCILCGSYIYPGESYYTEQMSPWKILSLNKFWTWKTHLECQRVFNRIGLSFASGFKENPEEYNWFTDHNTQLFKEAMYEFLEEEEINKSDGLSAIAQALGVDFSEFDGTKKLPPPVITKEPYFMELDDENSFEERGEIPPIWPEGGFKVLIYSIIKRAQDDFIKLDPDDESRNVDGYKTPKYLYATAEEFLFDEIKACGGIEMTFTEVCFLADISPLKVRKRCFREAIEYEPKSREGEKIGL